MPELLQDIRQIISRREASGSIDETSNQTGSVPAPISAVASVWRWIADSPEVSIGPDKKYNHLDLDGILNLIKPSGQDDSSSTQHDALALTPGSVVERFEKPEDLKVYLPEETMWECITGHGVDHKRVPRSEWLLLIGIATRKADGILQGDLGRLVEQDKRSVPKRTDALVKKGYIIKRTTLVRGTKTSKMWLRRFAPRAVKESDVGGDPEPAQYLTLSREYLIETLDPVPWHDRWSTNAVDYRAFATTITALVKEWGVIKTGDLKSKMGVLGSRWQMKVLAKTCRFLNSRGIIQYVAARLDDRVFKDCIKFIRDMNPQDWAMYLSTGKRGTSSSRLLGSGAADAPDEEGLGRLLRANPSFLRSYPAWSIDEPLALYLVKVIRFFRDTGLTNPDLYCLTVGSAYTRYVSALTSILANAVKQPEHLQHLQLRYEHVRAGKIASYRYFVQEPEVANGTARGNASAKKASQVTDYGFSPLAEPTNRNRNSSLTELCKFATSNPPAIGRLKAIKVEEVDDSQDKDVPHEAEDADCHVTPSSSRPTPANDSPFVRPESVASGTEVQEEPSEMQQSETQPGLSPGTNNKETPSDEVHGNSIVVALGEPALDSDSNHNSEEANLEDQLDMTPHQDNADVDTTQIEHVVSDIVENEEPESSTRGRGRGRGRGGRGRGRGRGRGGARGRKGRGAVQPGADPKPWKCEKCGGAWKNDLGLKYHLEKAKTTCNPNWDPLLEPPKELKKPKKMLRELASSGTTNDDRSGPVDLEDGALRAARAGLGRRSKVQTYTEEQAPDDDDCSPKVSRRTGTKVSNDRLTTVFSPPRTGTGLLLPFESGHVLKISDFFSFSHDGEANASNDLAEVEADISSIHPTELKPASGNLDNTIGDPLDVEMEDSLDPQLRDQRFEGEEKKQPTLGVTIQKDAAIAIASPKKPLARTERNQRIAGLLNDVLADSEGAFPGGDPLWRTLTALWISAYHGEPPPLTKDYHVAIRLLIQKKVIAEHWHAFRGSTGTFAKCQLVTLPDMDPFGSQCQTLLKKIKAAYPRSYFPMRPRSAGRVPYVFTGEVIRGRRPLPDAIQTLDAPVYTAQVAAKREQEESEVQTRKQKPRKSRKPRQVDIPTKDEDNLSGHASKRQRRRGIVEWVKDGFPHDSEPTPAFDTGPIVQFLEPNTFLGEEPPGYTAGELASPRKEARRRRQSTTIKQAAIIPDSYDVRIVPPKVVIQSSLDDSWPRLNNAYFEENEEYSFTLQGWMPSSYLYAWGSFVQEIENRHKVTMRRRRLRNPDESIHHSFVMSRLQACVNVEKSWETFFAGVVPTIAISPDIVYIHFPNTPIHEPELPLQLIWPGDLPDWSLEPTPDSEDSDESSWSEPDVRVAHEAQLSKRRRAQRQVQARDEKDMRKRIVLKSRHLTTLTVRPRQESEIIEVDNPVEVTAAIVAVRVLLGGTDRSIDWEILVHIFPEIGLAGIRKFWVTLRKSQAAMLAKFTSAFQDRFVTAYESNEVPTIDYENLLAYDWHALVRWTVEIPGKDILPIPPSVAELNERFQVHDAKSAVEDSREKFFHPQSSTLARLEAITQDPGAISLRQIATDEKQWQKPVVRDIDVAKSWLRSLCFTAQTRYPPEIVKRQLMTMDRDGNQNRANSLLTEAIDQLTDQRVIHKSARTPVGGRPWRLTEYYTVTLSKLAQKSKFEEALVFKQELDVVFRTHGSFTVPYALSDGAMMALMNMEAHKRLKLRPTNVPYIPFGLEPGNYETRKFPKSYYHFGLEVVPTDIYLFNEDIGVLRVVEKADPPLQGDMREIPQWLDFFGEINMERWRDIMGGFCFAYSTRGHLSIEGICSVMKPVLEEFEAYMIIEWGLKTTVLSEACVGKGVTVGEWWWLAIPWLR